MKSYIILLVCTLSLTNLLGQTAVRSYDSLGRITKEIYPDSLTITTTYDNMGNPVGINIQDPCSTKPRPIVTASGPLTFCAGDSVILSVTPGMKQLWSTGDTATSIKVSASYHAWVSRLDSFLYPVPGGTDTIQCYLTSDTATITVNPLPSAIAGVFTVCAGNMDTLSSASLGGIWSSSNTSLATVDSIAGIVTGVTSGTPVITYTLPTGCSITQAITVNVSPGAITGTLAVCEGFTTTLGASPSGGTWSSSNGSEATIGITSGIVTGVAAGIPTISYTLPDGCFSTASVTVNTTPPAPTDSIPLCVGIASLFQDATPGGAWSSSDLSIATIGSATGILTGIASGTLSVTYTLPTGCLSSMPVSINPVPAGIAGAGTVCEGATTALTNSTGGGSWSSSNSFVAAVGAGSGIVTGIAAGNAVITYTLPGGCIATWPMTVNPTPAPISGTSNICEGLTTTLTESTFGGSWSSSDISIATVSGGVVTGVSAGTVFITYTLPAGCYAIFPMTINPNPASIGGNVPVCVGSVITVTDVTIGGIWSSNDTTEATIDSISGTVTGITAGNPKITYRLSTGCLVKAILTVNPLPSPISGAVSVCEDLAITLSDEDVSGVWTSSNILVATVGSGTGIVTGISASTATITYSFATGCIATTLITVNPLPAAVSGNIPVCVAANITLTDASAGGTWSSSDASLATIGSGTGSMTGISAGNPVITYRLPTGCLATGIATVNPLPSAITGAGTVCEGATVTLSDATPGGTWTSSNIVTATIGSTGIVTGISAGTVTISYTLVTGCMKTASFTVNPTPAAITGINSVCTGFTTTLADAISGGTWTSSNTAQASAGSSSGIISGIAAGVPTITYTLPGGCFTTIPVTVNTAPDAGSFSLASVGSGCLGENLLVTITSASLGADTFTVTYNLSGANTATGHTATMVVTGSTGTFIIPASDLTSTGSTTITITAVTNRYNCFASISTGNVATFTVHALPPLHLVTGGGSYCAGSGGLHVGLYGSNAGIYYQLYNGTTPVGSPLTASGSAIDFGAQTTAGTYTVVGTDATTSCFATMTGSAVITINPVPDAYAMTGGGGYCAGGTGLSIGLSGSQTGVSYQLFNGTIPTGSPLTGTGAALTFGTYTVAGTYTVVATITATGCTATMSGSATITINPLPAIVAVTGGGYYCSGGSGVHVGLAGSAIGVNYQLYRGGSPLGSPVAGIGAALDFGLETVADTYTVVATNPTTLCSSAMSGFATVHIYSLPAVYSVTGGGSYCSGGSGVVVGVSNSAAGITYQLYRGGSPIVGSVVMGTGAAISFGLQTIAGTYTVIATNPGATCTSTMSGSAVITVTPPPLADTVTGGGGYCSGGIGVHVGLSSSSTGINYQLFRGTTSVGAAVAGTGSSLDFGLQTTAGTYTVNGTDMTTSCIGSMYSSVVVSISALPAAYAVSGGGIYCSGPGVHITLGGSNFGINYQLYRGTTAVGSSVSGTGASLDFGPQTIAGTYTIIATDATTGCVNNMTSSAGITVVPTPTIYTVTGGGSYCSGGTGLHIGLNGSDTGMSYQLFRGTTAVGSPLSGTGSPLDFGLQATAGTYTITGTNTLTTCSISMSGSAVISINALPSLYSVTGGGSYCSGGAGVHVGLSGSATGISYQLYNGSSTVGTALAGTSAPLDFGLQTASGTYTVVAVNTTTSCTNIMTGSATVTINPLPEIYTVTGGGGYCSGPGVVVGLSSSQSGINYQLYNGTSAVGSAVSGTGAAINLGALTIAGTFTATGINATTGCVSNMTGSATVFFSSPPPAYTVTGGGTYCAGGTGFHVGLSNSNTGINYQLYRGAIVVGSALPGTGSPLDFGLQTTAGVYTVIAANASTSCINVMTGSATITVDPLPAIVAVTGGGGYCSGDTGVHVGTAGSASGVNYQLYRGTTAIGSPVSGIGAALDFGLQTTAGIYTVVATDSASCTSNMSGSATVTIYSLPVTYSVTGGGSYCSGGTGVHIGLNGSNTGIGYQLFLAGTPFGSPVSGTGTPLDFGLYTAGGTYTAVATNLSYGCKKNMNDSAIVIVNPLPVISGGSTLAPSSTLTLSGSPSGGAWTSTVSSVATVGSSTGIVTGVSLGTTVIGYTISTGCQGSHNIIVTSSGHKSAQHEDTTVVVGDNGRIKVIPNPNNGSFILTGTIDGFTSESQEVSVQITDMLGQTVYEEKFSISDATIHKQIQLKNTIASGTYILRFHAGTENAMFHIVIDHKY